MNISPFRIDTGILVGLSLAELSQKKDEFAGQLDVLRTNIKKGYVLRSQGDFLVQEDDGSIPHGWVSRIRPNKNDTVASDECISLLRHLCIVMLKANDLSLETACKRQIGVINSLCNFIIFGKTEATNPWESTSLQFSLHTFVITARDGNNRLWSLTQDEFGKEVSINTYRRAFTVGIDRGITGLWLAVDAARTGKPALWCNIQSRFGYRNNEITITDYRAAPKTGPDAGITMIWVALLADMYKQSEAWDYLHLKFGEKLTAKECMGLLHYNGHENVSGLWVALLLASGGKRRPLEWLLRRFHHPGDLKLSYFLCKATTGACKGISGLWLALHLAAATNSSDFLLLMKAFWKDLHIDSFTVTAEGPKYAGISGVWHAAHGLLYDNNQGWINMLSICGKDLKFDHLRATAQAGDCAGTPAFYFILETALLGCIDTYKWLIKNCLKDIVLPDLQKVPTHGPLIGVNGIWLALRLAIKGHKELWNHIAPMRHEITLNDLRCYHSENSTYDYRTGLELAILLDFDWVKAQFGDEITLNDLLGTPATPDGRSRVSLFCQAFMWTENGDERIWEWIHSRFENRITLNNFRSSPGAIANAHSNNTSRWRWLETQFLHDFTLQDFRDNECTLLLACIATAFRSQVTLWNLVVDKFFTQLTARDFAYIAKNKKVFGWFLQRLSLEDNARELLYTFLATCAGMPLPVFDLSYDAHGSDVIKNFMCNVYIHYAEVNRHFDHNKLSETELNAKIQHLIAAHADRSSETFFLFAKCVLARNSYVTEAQSIYRQIDTESFFYHAAQMELFEPLYSGTLDIQGNAIELLPEHTQPTSRRQALEEALRITFRVAQGHDNEFMKYRTNIVNRLLGNTMWRETSKHLDWLEDEEDVVIVLNYIEELKNQRALEQQEQTIRELQQKLEDCTL